MDKNPFFGIDFIIVLPRRRPAPASETANFSPAQELGQPFLVRLAIINLNSLGDVDDQSGQTRSRS